MSSSNPVMPPSQAVKFHPAFEQVSADEAQTTQGLIEVLTKIQNKVYDDSAHAERGVHAKSHGLLTGEMRVLEGLPPELAQGLFASPASFPVVMRISTIPGEFR